MTYRLQERYITRNEKDVRNYECLMKRHHALGREINQKENEYKMSISSIEMQTKKIEEVKLSRTRSLQIHKS